MSSKSAPSACCFRCRGQEIVFHILDLQDLTQPPLKKTLKTKQKKIIKFHNKKYIKNGWSVLTFFVIFFTHSENLKIVVITNFNLV